MRHTVILVFFLAATGALELWMPASLRVETWLAVMALMAAFGLVVGQGITGRWLGVLIDTQHKMSLARLQMGMWTSLLLSALLTAVAANVDAGLSQPLRIIIPAELWLLMGISTASMLGSPVIQSVKRRRSASAEDQRSAEAWLARTAAASTPVSFQGQLVVNPSADAASIADLFQGSEAGTVGLVDVGQVQMLFFTLVVWFAYSVALAGRFSAGAPMTSLPSMDAGMLALLGISHAGFLANKAIQQPNGPTASNTQ